MSAPKIFPIKENVSELKKLRQKRISMIAKRIDALLIFKANEIVGISKRSVAEILRVDQNSILRLVSSLLETYASIYASLKVEKRFAAEHSPPRQ